MNIGMTRVLLIGPRRPPFGGIEVYLKNLEAGLRQRGLAVEVIDIVPRARDGTPRFRFHHKLLRFLVTMGLLLRSRATVVHLLSSSYTALNANLLRALVAHWSGKRVILSLMGGMAGVVIQGSAFKRWLLAWLFSQVDTVIACNDQIYRALTELLGPSARSELISNALPFEIETHHDLPVAVEQFLRRHRPVLLCIGGPSYEYGLHTLVTALASVQERIPETAACVLTRLPMAGDYPDQVRRLAQSFNLEQALFFIEKVEDTASLMLRCDVVVRSTLTDGDSMSVREALLLGRPVVASDAASRPEGCILFRAGDHNHLADQLIHVLTEAPRVRPEPRELQIEGQQNLRTIVSLYNALGGDGRQNKPSNK